MSWPIFFLYFLAEYLTGSIMFSFILGKISGKDLREFLDGNPGGTNLWRLKGFRWGFPGIFLDYLKGFIPLYFILSAGRLTTFQLTLISIAPLLGHIFPPMLKFKGGKGISTTFGVWSALTKYEVPLILGTVYALFVLIKRKGTTPEFDAVRALTGIFVVTVFVFLFRRDFIFVALLNAFLLVFTHRREIGKLIKKFVFSLPNFPRRRIRKGDQKK
ncbi:MAG: glycerol-3-phosphate acyltransferase [Caldiserica bacterium]|nr:glycerol-3-phosphate acyltransferase [Caldisericota bacterium]MDH7562822.1 glycerol-3-phosphate acyltransferase [Caldisericota bacterium]